MDETKTTKKKEKIVVAISPPASLLFTLPSKTETRFQDAGKKANANHKEGLIVATASITAAQGCRRRGALLRLDPRGALARRELAGRAHGEDVSPATPKENLQPYHTGDGESYIAGSE